MPTLDKIDKEHKLELTTGSGFVTKEEVLTLQDRMSNDPEFYPRFFQVADFAQLRNTEIGLADGETFARRDEFSIYSRRAIIVKGDVAFGFAKIFELYRQLPGASGIRVFRNPEEPFDWILHPDSASTSRLTEWAADSALPRCKWALASDTTKGDIFLCHLNRSMQHHVIS